MRFNIFIRHTPDPTLGTARELIAADVELDDIGYVVDKLDWYPEDPRFQQLEIEKVSP